MVAVKTCSRCKGIKTLDKFVIRNKLKSGKGAYCKACNSEVAKINSIKKWGSFRNLNLVKNYGITIDDYDRMYEDKEGLCYICGRQRNLVVDHDHKTGKVRKLLCSGCNTGIAQFEHNPSLFEKAKEYVS